MLPALEVPEAEGEETIMLAVECFDEENSEAGPERRRGGKGLAVEEEVAAVEVEEEEEEGPAPHGAGPSNFCSDGAGPSSCPKGDAGPTSYHNTTPWDLPGPLDRFAAELHTLEAAQGLAKRRAKLQLRRPTVPVTSPEEDNNNTIHSDTVESDAESEAAEECSPSFWKGPMWFN